MEKTKLLISASLALTTISVPFINTVGEANVAKAVSDEGIAALQNKFISEIDSKYVEALSKWKEAIKESAAKHLPVEDMDGRGLPSETLIGGEVYDSLYNKQYEEVGKLTRDRDEFAKIQKNC